MCHAALSEKNATYKSLKEIGWRGGGWTEGQRGMGRKNFRDEREDTTKLYFHAPLQSFKGRWRHFPSSNSKARDLTMDMIEGRMRGKNTEKVEAFSIFLTNLRGNLGDIMIFLFIIKHNKSHVAFFSCHFHSKA